MANVYSLNRNISLDLLNKLLNVSTLIAFQFSSNFARKLKFVSTLKELSSHIKTDFIYIPDEVVR